MRDYLETSMFPSIKIGRVSVPRLILGNLPFLGESYQGPERNRNYAERFGNIDTTIKLLKHAISDYGLTVVGVMPPMMGQLSRLFFEALKTASAETGVDVGLIACFMIPLSIRGKKVDDCRRWLTYHMIEARNGIETSTKYLTDPILLCREGWAERFSQAIANLDPYGSEEIEDMTLDVPRLKDVLLSLEGFRILLIEPGSETDFLTLTGRTDILEEAVSTARDRMGCPVVVGTHHAGSTIPILEDTQIDISGYVTPLNTIGALMLPTVERALRAIRSARRPVIAIKAMAGGRVPPKEAFRHVFDEVGVASCMIGVATEAELREDVQAASHFILRKDS